MRKYEFIQKFNEADFNSPQGFNRHFTIGDVLFQYDEAVSTTPTKINVGYGDTEKADKTGYVEKLELGYLMIEVSTNRMIAEGYTSRDDLVKNYLWAEYRDHLKRTNNA